MRYETAQDRVDALVDACRVPAFVQPRSRGLWTIKRLDVTTLSLAQALRAQHLGQLAHYSTVTTLHRITAETMMGMDGECVMDDSPKELRRHLPILLAARGRVLLTGLGLGCVLRGLLSKDDVEHVDVIEVDRSILDLVGSEFASDPRVSIFYGDARTIKLHEHDRWHYAWHDVWDEHEALDIVHAQLIARFRPRVRSMQGAWRLARPVRRMWAQFVVPLLGDKRSSHRQHQRAAHG